MESIEINLMFFKKYKLFVNIKSFQLKLDNFK